jgi:peptide/nickel transport system substrate-binding protein
MLTSSVEGPAARGPSRRSFLLGLVGISVGGLLAACGAPAPSAAPTGAPAAASKPAGTGGTLNYVLEDDPLNLDPLLSSAFIDRHVHYQMYDSLVRIDPTGKIIPWLAESWDISPDSKTVTFNLRKDVTYHDGTRFDADSARWNIERYRTTDGSLRKGELAPVDSVQVVDASTLRLTLKAPFAPLLSVLADRASMMVSQKAVDAAGQDFTRKAFRAGTGPFVLTEAVKDDHLTLERNPSWWGAGMPYLDKVIMRPIRDPTTRLTNLRTGEADVVARLAGKDVAAAKSDANLTYTSIPGLAFDDLIPNRRPGFVFEDSRNVKAVAMAIDRQEILDRVFLGVGSVAYGMVAPPHFAYDASFQPYAKADPDGARRLVSEVGKGPLEFELLVASGDSEQLQLAQLIQAQLKKADISMDIVTLETAAIAKQQSIDHTFKGMTQVQWSGRVDPDGNTYDQVYTGRPFNDGGYSNSQVDQLLDEQRTTLDEARRTQALRKAEQIYVVDDPARVWYRFRVSELTTAKRVQGLQVYPDGIVRLQYAKLAS